MRDEHGNLHLSKAAKAFHPGQGVYRSSYMNARRLAATETNMAYRTADYLRWQQFDFVVGIEIHLSNNHNCKGVPAGMFYDICDELKGKYPKDFVFTGWHPHCRCYATTILKTPEEMEADTERILDGEPTDTKSVNAVEEVPPQFSQWLEQNEQRIAEAKSLPYFLSDNGTRKNGKYTLNDLGSESSATEPKHPTIAQRAAERHAARTQEQVAGIKQKWYNRQLDRLSEDYFNGILPKETAHTIQSLYRSVKKGEFDRVPDRISTLQAAAQRHAARTADDIRRIQDLVDEHTYGKEYVEHIHKIETALGIKRGKRMSHFKANQLRGNPYFAFKTPYGVNCQSCVVAYELRLLGFDVSAMPNLKTAGNLPYELSKATNKAWRDPASGDIAKKQVAGKLRLSKSGKRWVSASEKQLTQELHDLTAEKGRYHINWGWKQKKSGHIITLERFKDGTYRLYDPQTGKNVDWSDLLEHIKRRFGVEVLRVDDKLFNLDYAGVVIPASKAQGVAEKTLGKKLGKAKGGVSGAAETNKELYERLRKDPDYRDVVYNPNNDGLKAVNKEHNFDKKGGRYEFMAQEAGYKRGDAVVFEKELYGSKGQRFAEGVWNGKKFEVAGSETATANNLVAKLSHCGSKPGTKIAVIVFPNGGYDYKIIDKAIRRFKGLKKTNPRQYHTFERVICVQDNEIVCDIPF